jgi:hypothetical protein
MIRSGKAYQSLHDEKGGIKPNIEKSTGFFEVN